jgi:hypothetical protein
MQAPLSFWVQEVLYGLLTVQYSGFHLKHMSQVDVNAKGRRQPRGGGDARSVRRGRPCRSSPQQAATSYPQNLKILIFGALPELPVREVAGDGRNCLNQFKKNPAFP